MGTTLLSSTGTQDHRHQKADMARLLGPLLYRALLGLICMTGEEGTRVLWDCGKPVSGRGARGGSGRGRGASKACRAKTGRASHLRN